MKRFIAALFCLILGVLLTVGLVSYNKGNTPNKDDTPAVCQHRDADDNSLCDKCGESYTDGTDVTPPPEHTHAWGSWITITPATCQAHGMETRICDCGATESRYIDKDTNNHTAWSNWSVTTPATCQAKGVETRTCACGEDETRDVAINPNAHNFDEWSVTTPATCQTKGVETRTCACGEAETRDVAIDPSAHTYDTENTCTGCLDYKDKGVVFTLQEDNTYSITDYTGNATEVIIPSKYQGVAVTSISERAFEYCRRLTSITIPSSVTSIGSFAFLGCYKLIEVYNLSSLNIKAGSSNHGDVAYYAKNVYTATTGKSKLFTDENDYIFYDDGTNRYLMGYSGTDTALTLPASCKGNNYEIYQYAFYERDDIASVTIPNSVTNIGSYAFYGCSELTAVYITDLAAWCNISFGSSSSNPLYYAKNLYLNGNKVTALEIPSGVTSIKQYAFSGCSGLTSITIPESVTSIGEGAFYGCSGLTSITIPESVTSIGEDAFYGCSGLTGVYITDLATWCNISFGNNEANPLYYAKNLYLNGNKVTSLEIPSGVTSIKPYAFSGCSGLTSVTIGNSVTSIGSTAFVYCSGLTSITIGSGVTSIGYAFYGCNSLESITLPFVGASSSASGYQSHFGYIFGYNASSSSSDSYHYFDSSQSPCRYFTYCIPTSLRSVTITDGETSIGNNAFRYCRGLTSITIPNSVTFIGSDAFYRCSGLESITVESGNTVYHSAGNCLIETASKTLLVGCNNSAIPTDGSVTSISDYAFYYCSGLTSITIPNSVKSIGDEAFYGCNGLESITLPFVGASSSASGYQSHFGYIFGYRRSSSSSSSYHYYDSSQSSNKCFTYYIPTSLRSVTITDGVRSIGSYTFKNCSGLTSITIPNSVTSIGDHAFYYCSGLTSINYRGTEAQWKAITKGDYWNYGTGGYTINYEYTGE